MNDHMLHLLSPARTGDPAVIAGDHQAMHTLKLLLERALQTGAAAAQFYSSDGEPFLLRIVQQTDMSTVCTTYLGELTPVCRLFRVPNLSYQGL